MKTKLLSIGNNRKLGKKIGIFNLPQGVTCPGRTALCEKICYAAKAERLYKAAATMRVRNLDFISQYGTDGFIAAMRDDIRNSNVTMLRIHESGDFYSQTYLDAWVAIVASCPNVKFLAYTKSFHLDWTAAQALPNWSILWSVDPTTTAAVPPGATAYLLPKGGIPPAALTCVHTSKKHYCGVECKLCWTGKHNVYFPQH